MIEFIATLGALFESLDRTYYAPRDTSLCNIATPIGNFRGIGVDADWQLRACSETNSFR